MFGLVSFGTELGAPVAVRDVVADYSPDVERVLGYGYTTVHRAADGVELGDLALTAARRALAAARVRPTDLDLLVLAVTDMTEYLYWDAAAALQTRLGATRAEAVLVPQACTAALSGLDLVAGRFATHPGYGHALVVAANRCCEPYWNRMQTQSMVFSDGAVATVARRDHPSCRWLVSETITDGRFADFYRMDVGGSARPFGSPAADGADVGARDAWDIMEFFDYDEARFEEFARLIDDRARDVVDRACGRAGVAREDLAAVVLLHDNARALHSLTDALDVDPGRTNRDIALATGHVGAADQLYSLQRMLADGRLAAGDVVALVGIARGMHWSCTLVEA